MQFTETHVITLTYNILCALNLIHKLNIMHRDIKPENILVNRDCQVKICDFGLARTVPKNVNSIPMNDKKLNQELFSRRNSLFSATSENSKDSNVSKEDMEAMKEKERELIS